MYGLIILMTSVRNHLIFVMTPSLSFRQSIKAFYMRENDDGKTVAAMDLLVPRVRGEGGGGRFSVLATISGEGRLENVVFGPSYE